MRSGAGVYQHDLQWRQCVADALQLQLHVGGGHHVAVRESTKVEFYRGLQTPFERHLVDGDGPPAPVDRGGIHRRGVMVGRVEVRPVVGGDPDTLDRPALPRRKIIDCRAGEKRHDLLRRLAVVVVIDLRQMPRRVRVDPGLQRNREVDEPPPRHRGQC